MREEGESEVAREERQEGERMKHEGERGKWEEMIGGPGEREMKEKSGWRSGR